MRYKEEEVLDILSKHTKNPKESLKEWNINKSNTFINLDKFNYPYFVYSFPLIVNNEEVGLITLVSLYGGNLNNEKPDLMLKYFGYSDYGIWDTFSHDTYLDCYLSITKEFNLPEIVKGFRCETFKSKDAMNKEFEFIMSYGYPEDEDDLDSVEKFMDLTYRFDNGVSLEVPKINGWSLGEKINQNIRKRKRNENINDILKIN